MSEQTAKTEPGIAEATEQTIARKPYVVPELVVLKGGDTEGKTFFYHSEVNASFGPS